MYIYVYICDLYEVTLSSTRVTHDYVKVHDIVVIILTLWD